MVLCILLLAASGHAGCRTDVDCSLNGICNISTGQCACDPSWSGDACNTLLLLPAASPTAAHVPGLHTREADGRNTSSWGGQVLWDPSTGLYNMWAAEMINNCGINSWTRNSRIVHATSPRPDGAFTRDSVVRQVFAHEPSVTRAPDGTFVMYYTAFLQPAERAPCQCQDGSTDTSNCTNGMSDKDPTFMATAPSAAGPWSKGQLVPLLDCNRTFCQHDMNLAGLILPNGSFVGMVKVHHKYSEIRLVRAEDYRKTQSYMQAPNDEGSSLFPGLGLGLEDPDLWIDARGAYHAVFHAIEPTSRLTGAHACSTDGLRWHYTGIAYNATVHFSDGSATTFSRRERPHVVFANPAHPRTPTHLSTAVQYGGKYGDATFTLVQPIAT